MGQAVAFFFALFKAVAGVATLAGYAKDFATLVMAWYVESMNRETLAQIADAAAFAARAKTPEDRYAAAQKWRDALSRPRVG